MANPELVEIVRQGTLAIREWRERNPTERLDLFRADLGTVNLSKANLTGADLTKADLSRAELGGADLSESLLFGANLSEADLSNANLFAAHLYTARLHGATLRGADLCGANFSDAQLFGADLREADLHGAILRGADLRQTQLNGVNLRGANLTAACLRAANLSRANLTVANLSGAELDGAVLTQATVGGTNFSDLDLAGTQALATVVHEGPSSIGVDTLAKSRGAIPQSFLRGCGLAPWQVLDAQLCDPALAAEQIAALQQQVFQVRTRGRLCLGGVFLSYSSADAEFVGKVQERLQTQGVPTWLDLRDSVAGPLDKHIFKAIRPHDVVVPVLSEASLASGWVVGELEMARRKQQSELRDVLCPVALDDGWRRKLDPADPDRALWLTLKHDKSVLDFSQWRDEALFELQCARLVRGLRIYAEPPGK